ncbi:MAG: indole-3-glycerol-phosphate synthase [Microcystis wesenbergii Mw_QC_S_20081001_S30D]|uniref:Indole-3-glycerol-phosphate synthase n=2 Tax=Microcystis wesenbergii TaxID=44823 RepID=A0A552LK74_9CHRO|nr:MAG: indole-3-glycerol-phosphate synthase [Microcystis wesenbergii Mw_QC_S_20081001_S30]TRV01930.1 MAG: indole-3-glycerol-phosphate synthase [Microcystis wesenbergii Mw_QC_S_20081001_S30D]TRV03319.1 MAG: indole-3-glycerol-phosphate synthase [Microcystis wesenbergii Mw_QC_B_20070930_S4D]TRV12133.1 MAG: indole-3-glycerol-phosphate synthase [Microcystis wesenbergii Mw_QC_B_20070930_S4]TRV20628.1 MAG: indole-3-glycerol-phosphate synthase [Microcystis wesenbergii Mw_MB_S_20031200_S109D]
MSGVGCWSVGVVGNLAEISLSPYLPKSLSPDDQLPKRKTSPLR